MKRYTNADLGEERSFYSLAELKIKVPLGDKGHFS